MSSDSEQDNRSHTCVWGYKARQKDELSESQIKGIPQHLRGHERRNHADARSVRRRMRAKTSQLLSRHQRVRWYRLSAPKIKAHNPDGDLLVPRGRRLQLCFANARASTRIRAAFVSK